MEESPEPSLMEFVLQTPSPADKPPFSSLTPPPTDSPGSPSKRPPSAPSSPSSNRAFASASALVEELGECAEDLHHQGLDEKRQLELEEEIRELQRQLQGSLSENRILSERLELLQGQLREALSKLEVPSDAPPSGSSVTEPASEGPPEITSDPISELSSEVQELAEAKAHLLAEFLDSTEALRQRIGSSLSFHDQLSKALGSSKARLSALSASRSLDLATWGRQAAALQDRSRHLGHLSTALPTVPGSLGAAAAAAASFQQLRPLIELRTHLASLCDDLKRAHGELVSQLATVEEGERALQGFGRWLAFLEAPGLHASLLFEARPEELFERQSILIRQLGEAEERCHCLAQENGELLTRLNQETEANQALAQRFSELEQSVQRAEIENQALVEKLGRLGSSMESISQTLREKEAFVRELEVQRDQIMTLLRQRGEEISRLQALLEQKVPLPAPGQEPKEEKPEPSPNAPMNPAEEPGLLLDGDQLDHELEQEIQAFSAQALRAQEVSGVTRLRLEFEQLERKCVQLEDYLRDAEAEILELRGILEISVAELAEAHTRVATTSPSDRLRSEELAQRLEDKTCELDEAEGQLVILQERLEEREQALIATSHELSSLLEENDDLLIKLNLNGSLLDDQKKRAEILLMEREAFEGELLLERENLARVKAENTIIKAELEQCRQSPRLLPTPSEGQIEIEEAEGRSQGLLDQALQEKTEALTKAQARIAELEGENERLLSQTTTSQEAAKNLEESLRAELTSLWETFEEKARTSERLAKELSTSQSQLSLSQLQTSELEGLRAQLEGDLERKGKLVSDLEEALKTLTADAASLTRSLEERQTALEEKESAIFIMSETIGEKEEELNESSRENQRLRDRLSELCEKERVLNEQLALGETQRTELSQQLEASQQQCKGLETELETLTRQLGEEQQSKQIISGELGTLLPQLEALKEQLEAQVPILTELQATLSTKSSLLEATEEECSKLRVDLASALQSHEQGKRALEGAQASNQEEIRSLSEQLQEALSTLEKNRHAQEEEHGELLEKIESLECAKAGLLQEIAELSSQFEALEEKVKEEEAHSTKLRTKVSELTEALERKEQALLAEQVKVQTLEEALSSEKEQLAEQLEKNEELRLQAEELTGKGAKQAEQQLQGLTEQLETSRQQLHSLAEEKSRLEILLDSERTSHQVLSTQLETIRASLDRAEREAQGAKEDTLASHKELEQLRGEREASTQALEEIKAQLAQKSSELEEMIAQKKELLECQASLEKKMEASSQSMVAVQLPLPRAEEPPTGKEDCQPLTDRFPLPDVKEEPFEETLSQRKRKKSVLSTTSKKLKQDVVPQSQESPDPKKNASLEQAIENYSPDPKKKLSESLEQIQPTLSQTSRSKKKKNVVVAFSGFKHNHPEFHLEKRQILAQAVEKLGGKVKNESEFDTQVTHVVSPPNSRTVKTLAAVLTNRWLVSSKWILDSLEAGYFVDEQEFGIRSTITPFKGKKFFLAESFIKENEKKESKLQNCKSLVVLFGKGEITKELKKADYVLKAAGDQTRFQCPSLDWEGFLDLIPSGGKLPE